MEVNCLLISSDIFFPVKSSEFTVCKISYVGMIVGCLYGVGSYLNYRIVLALSYCISRCHCGG
jgi:hypothetical protein